MLAQFANDTALLCRSINKQLAGTYLQRAVNAITDYFHKKHLIINAQKTQLLPVSYTHLTLPTNREV